MRGWWLRVEEMSVDGWMVMSVHDGNELRDTRGESVCKLDLVMALEL